MSATAAANGRAARALVDELARCGVREVCVCPGSRSTPLVLALAGQERIRTWTITDERSAGFFALGMARASGRCAAVVCTSGTAAANLMPATAEADLSSTPLLLLTADRPGELRGCGAAQTIDQVGLLDAHARWSVDVVAPTGEPDLEAYSRTVACRAVATAAGGWPGPVHLNLQYREPLMETPVEVERPRPDGRGEGSPWTTVYQASTCPAPGVVARIADVVVPIERGVIVCGPGAVAAGQGAPVVELARRLAWPLLADPLSGLRYGEHRAGDLDHVVDCYDVLLRSSEFCDEHRPDVILRLGAVPTSKPLMRYLEQAEGARQVLVTAGEGWPDPSFTTSDLVRGDAADLCRALVAATSADRRGAATAVASGRGEAGVAGSGEAAAARVRSGRWLHSWLRPAACVSATLGRELAACDEPFEGRIAGDVVAAAPTGACLYVGNSMPVRDVDTFAGSRRASLEVLGNRGANGIDGVLSSALGAAAIGLRPVTLLVGDLSFLHDIGALQIAARHAIDLLVVVVNNDGGAIFSFLPPADLGKTLEDYFVTPHGLELEPAVRMCGGSYVRTPSVESLGDALAHAAGTRGLRVIEVPVDREGNTRRHREIVAAALADLAADGEAAA